jgi:hypothetical protein
MEKGGNGGGEEEDKKIGRTTQDARLRAQGKKDARHTTHDTRKNIIY